MANDDPYAAQYAAWMQGKPLPQDLGSTGWSSTNPFSYVDELSGKYALQGAARGAGRVAAQSQDFANEQWRRQMEGLQGALGSYGASQSYWDKNIGNQGPGAMEDWWRQNQSGFNKEGQQQGAYNDYKNWMSQPGYSQLGYAQAGQSLAGTNNAAGAYGAMGQGLQSYGGPTNGQEAYRFNQGDYQKAGAGENWYAQNKGRYGQETNSQANYDALAGRLYAPGASQNLYSDVNAELIGGQGAAQQALQGHQAFANGPTALTQNEGENKGMIRGANQIADYYKSQQGALQGPGAYENFVTSDIAGTNPLYQRTRDEGIAKINQEMARRGSFNSGGALTAIGNYTGALDAADYENRANRAQQAQQMQLARIGQGGQLAGQVTGADIQRGTSLGSLDTANESARVARQGIGLSAEQQASNERIASLQLAMSMAGQSDSTQLARLKGAQDMGQSADAANLGQLNAGQNAASDAQSQLLARLMGSQNSANSVDQTRLSSDQQALQRMLASFNMAQGADQTGLARAQQQYGMGMGMDQFGMSKYAQQGNMAQGADQFGLAQLLGGGQMAGQAQSAQQQRMAQAFGSLFGMNNAEAGQYGQFYGQGGQLSGQAFSDAMNALMAQYGYQAQASGATGEFVGKGLGLATQYYGGKR